MLKSTFVFCSLKSWITGITSLSVKNYGFACYVSAVISGGAFVSEWLIKPSWFGTTYLVLLLVHLTLFANAAFGIWKNSLKSQVFLAMSQKYEPETKEYRINIRRWKSHKFDLKKLYFVFFKSFSFLAYLSMIKALTSDAPQDGGWEITALFLTTEILIRVPIVLFWYYEFKSIGENSTYIFGQKAKIFTIVELIFEPRISKFIGAKTPADGKNNDDFNPEDV